VAAVVVVATVVVAAVALAAAAAAVAATVVAAAAVVTAVAVAATKLHQHNSGSRLSSKRVLRGPFCWVNGFADALSFLRSSFLCSYCWQKS